MVGEIEDETDPRAAALRQLTNGDWFVRGHVSLGDLADAGIELPVDTDAYNSVGGYVFGELGRLPKRGDTITANGYTIRVESVRENRIEAVRISGSVRPARLASPGNPRSAEPWRYRMWVVRLSDKQLEVLRALLRSEEHLGPALQRRGRGPRPGPLGRAARGRAALGGDRDHRPPPGHLARPT